MKKPEKKEEKPFFVHQHIDKKECIVKINLESIYNQCKEEYDAWIVESLEKIVDYKITGSEENSNICESTLGVIDSGAILQLIREIMGEK